MFDSSRANDRKLKIGGRIAMKITLDLNDEEIKYLRASTSDLGTNNKDCVSLQLKIANAVLDAKDESHPPKWADLRDAVGEQL